MVLKNIIDGLKAENKQILESEMRALNGVYLTLKDERDRLQSQLNRIEEENKKIVENAEKLKTSVRHQKNESKLTSEKRNYSRKKHHHF